MKTTRIKNWTAVCAAVVSVATIRAAADPSAVSIKPDRSYTGTIVNVDLPENTVKVKGWAFWDKTFNLGDNCAYALLENKDGTANELRPGEKVTVNYQNAHGVLIADSVRQQAMQFEGMVTKIDPAKHTLMLHRPGLDKQLSIADGCNIVLRGDKAGTLADIHPGNHVTVTYETPGGTPMARQIAQTSMAFTGTLTAIDLGERTVKARTMFDSKKFNVADDCAIVINGRPDGKLSDLKPDEQLVFNYDEINGVNVVNRIAPAEAREQSVAANTPKTAGD
jgi:predicted RNA-binding protein